MEISNFLKYYLLIFFKFKNVGFGGWGSLVGVLMFCLSLFSCGMGVLYGFVRCFVMVVVVSLLLCVLVDFDSDSGEVCG